MKLHRSNQARPADVAARYPMNKPDLSQFRKFEVALDGRQQLYVLLHNVSRQTARQGVLTSDLSFLHL